MTQLTLPEKIVIAILITIFFLAAGGGYFLWQNNKTANTHLSNEELVKAVSQIAQLPNEQPAIATITDREKVAAQFPFFAQAETGDRVLIYNEAKKAYLYRPSTHKIVEVGPILIAENPPSSIPAELTDETNEASVAAVKSEPATVTLLNGTKGKGVAAKAEKELAETELNIEIKTTGNAKNDYSETEIAIITESAKEAAEQIAKQFNGKIVQLPKGESTPKTDVVVFLGEDRL